MTEKPKLPQDEKQKEKKKKFFLTLIIILLLGISGWFFWSALKMSPEEEVKKEEVPIIEEEQIEKETEEYTIYKVESGDTLWSIAKKFNVTVDDIIKANELEDPNKLQVGQELKIPKEKTSSFQDSEEETTP